MCTTIIIGNGIGMAIDPVYFELQNGLKQGSEKFKSEQIDIIKLGEAEMPKKEDELEAHHKILSACNELTKHNKKIEWLTEKGKEFPSLYQNYIYQVAKYFYSYDISQDCTDTVKVKKFNDFIDRLIEYMKKEDICHIATLNYDKLLYKAFVNKRKVVFDGYNRLLIDGFHQKKDGFKPDHLLRSPSKKFGWYMHLHGSPLFRTNNKNEVIKKCDSELLPTVFDEDGYRHDHIVLVSPNLKPSVIAKSSLLDSYFDYFIDALAESEKIIVFGYSGKDTHVNLAIKRRLSTNSDLKVQVIEWESNYKKAERDTYWKDLFGERSVNLEVKLIPSILDYDFNFS